MIIRSRWIWTKYSYTARWTRSMQRQLPPSRRAAPPRCRPSLTTPISKIVPLGRRICGGWIRPCWKRRCEIGRPISDGKPPLHPKAWPGRGKTRCNTSERRRRTTRYHSHGPDQTTVHTIINSSLIIVQLLHRTLLIAYIISYIFHIEPNVTNY